MFSVTTRKVLDSELDKSFVRYLKYRYEGSEMANTCFFEVTKKVFYFATSKFFPKFAGIMTNAKKS